MSDNAQDAAEPSLASAGSHGLPTVDEYRTALQKCVAEKAADWKAACESAELASKEINRLRLTEAELASIELAAMEYEVRAAKGVGLQFSGPKECAEQAATLRGLLERTK